jgi:hypothetical protein
MGGTVLLTPPEIVLIIDTLATGAPEIWRLQTKRPAQTRRVIPQTRKEKITMQSQLDAAITAAASAEAVYSTDAGNVATIQAGIATATSPLAPAQAQLATDAAAFNASLDALAAAAVAAKIPASN